MLHAEAAAAIERDVFLKIAHVIQLGREPILIDILTRISRVVFDETWKSREEGKISNVDVFLAGTFQSKTNARLIETKIVQILNYWRRPGRHVRDAVVFLFRVKLEKRA